MDHVGDNGSGHRELDGGGVHDSHDVARSGRLKKTEERAVEAILGIDLDYLLVVVGALVRRGGILRGEADRALRQSGTRGLDDGTSTGEEA